MSGSMTFYEVAADVDRFQYFLIDEAEEGRWYHGGDRHVVPDGRPWADTWHPPKVFSYQPRLPEGDFWGVLSLAGACFAVRPEALEQGHLEVFLGPAGELLPLPYDGREFRVLNVTECIDALDQERTVWDRFVADLDDPGFADLGDETRQAIAAEPEVVSVESPRFRLDRLGWPLFKVPETAISHMYYREYSEDGEDEQFRRYCEREGLTGLTFEEIYSVDVDWIDGELRELPSA